MAELISSDDETIFITQSIFTPHTEDAPADLFEQIVGDNSGHVPKSARDNFNLDFSDISSDDEMPRVIVPVRITDSDEELVSSLIMVKRQYNQQQQQEHARYTSINDTKEKPSFSRFHNPVCDLQVEGLQKKKFADSTVIKLRWAVNLFKDWQTHRNTLADEPNSTLDISPIFVPIEIMTKDELNFSISRFICEAKKRDGNDYPADTVYGLVISLQLYLDSNGKQYKFLNDDTFAQIQNTLDNIMKSRTRNHVGAPRRQAEVISLEEEDLMWAKGVLGSETPKQRLNTVVYMVGLNFALRGGKEHRDLRFGPILQLTVGQNDHGRYLMYVEDTSKTNQGGLKHRKLQPKSVVAYDNKDKPERCIVNLYDKYVLHRPPPTSKNTAFYLRPLEKPKDDIWYSN